MKKHTTESVISLPTNPRIEGWVQKVLAIQRRLIDYNSTLYRSSNPSDASQSDTGNQSETSEIMVEKKTDVNENAKETTEIADSSNSESENVAAKGKQVPSVHQCQYCSYSCKAASDMRKHEKRHWVQKPLKCGHCDVEGKEMIVASVYRVFFK